jgi:hypothetical protein
LDNVTKTLSQNKTKREGCLEHASKSRGLVKHMGGPNLGLTRRRKRRKNLYWYNKKDTFLLNNSQEFFQASPIPD